MTTKPLRPGSRRQLGQEAFGLRFEDSDHAAREQDRDVKDLLDLARPFLTPEERARFHTQAARVMRHIARHLLCGECPVRHDARGAIMSLRGVTLTMSPDAKGFQVKSGDRTTTYGWIELLDLEYVVSQFGG